MFRLGPDPGEPSGSQSSQGSVSDEITRKTMSYEESRPPGAALENSSRSSSQSGGEAGGRNAPAQSHTLPRTFGQNEASNEPQQGASTMPRSQGKAKGTSKYW